ncbi:arabinogalactan oligomer / maltooligosaccharide transport system substrate-binding protein [Pseudobutyrivibrio sp. ACV-2]|uniref:extracellular solute-binding protein n=1 Tax=Pseudobutyrivibrio sp. ACV-2 TaxID=1520801 RepID=UPI000894CA32|nr:extracellular solute-binding protein [Pseudobutyrivibrio sp. ACV-2]SDZ77227.1 arabinogalactan oligomer / maltooligosaccharide transport system substrate-binding protein [Pseudobutyrivibrio sp. ACV-2]
MKKKLLCLLLSSTLLMGMVGCGDATGSAKTTGTDDEESLYAEDAKLKLWGSQDDQEYLQDAIDSFKEDFPEAANWDIELAVVSSADAKDQVLKDTEEAADVFEFASDQLYSLVTAGTLYKITSDREDVESRTTKTAVDAAILDGNLYGYPSTSNSYIMYYDKSKYTEDDVKNLDTILSKDLGSDVNFAMDLDNGWYMASFFFGNGCTLFGTDGQDASECSFNNENGLEVGNYILDLTHNKKVGNYDDTLLLSGFADRTLGAAITGTWNAVAIKEYLGDDFGVTTFPTVNLAEGKEVQPSPIVNFNIYGVNAQTKYPLEAMALANYITSEKIQKLRFEQRSSTPVCNSLIEDKELLGSNPAVSALAEQVALASTVQTSNPQISNFWSPMEAFGQDCIAGNITHDNMQQALDTLVESILAKLGE